MKRYHEKVVQKTPSCETGSKASPLPLAKDSAVSPQALALFRLIERLSRRTGYACVKLLATLAAMLEKSVRACRYALAELIAAGWVERRLTRKGGSKLFFRPLVRVASRSRGLFLAPRFAGCVAGCSPSSLQGAPSTPIRNTPVGKETTTQRATSTKPSASNEAASKVEALPVAVSLLKEVCSQSEAQELAREAVAQKLTPEQIKRVLAAYQSQASNIRNRGAWLREALRRGFSPPASVHASDQAAVPVHRPVLVSAASLDRMSEPSHRNLVTGATSAAQSKVRTFDDGLTAHRIAQPGALQGEQGNSGRPAAWEALRSKIGHGKKVIA